MAANAFFAYTKGFEAIFDGTVDIDTDSFRAALVTSSYTPNQQTDDTWSDISANEVANGNGYATHGLAATVTLSSTGLVITIDMADLSWASSTITASYLVLVHDADGNGALAATDIPIVCAELEDGGSVSTTNGTLSITINASGVVTVTLTAAT